MTQKNNKYLDYEGVSYLWDKIKEYIDEYILMPKYVSDKSEITNEGLYRTMLGATLTTIKDGKVYLDLSQLTTTSKMFEGCSSLTSLDVSNWDTSNVNNMSSMFNNCNKLTSLNVSNFDTSKVTNMDSMFYNCSKFTSLNVSNFDTSKVTDMGSMFYNCSSLTSLDVSNFDTSKVTNMDSMFYNCSKFTSLNVSNFDTSKVTDMGSMFYNCSSLTSLKFPGMGKTKSVTSIDLSACPLDRDSLLSIFDYNRVGNSITTKLSVKLSSTSKARLTEEEKAAITAKGYTIA